MTSVVLNAEQAKVVREATETIELRDSKGDLLGYVSPSLDADVIAEAKRRVDSDGPWFSTQQVLDHLRSLERT